MTFGSLFAGIDGIGLGLERAGLTCKWQVEKDNYALRVLEKHWPNVARYRDVRYFLGSKRWRRCRAAWDVDLIAGGFPCQDISFAGKGAGITGSRSGLWSEFARIIRLLRPRYVLVENVPALTVRGLNRVLEDLAELGFDAEWDRIPAAAVGAPHLRWRIFILAYAQDMRGPAVERVEPDGVGGLLVADADSRRGPNNGLRPGRAIIGSGSSPPSDTDSRGLKGSAIPRQRTWSEPVDYGSGSESLADPNGERCQELHVPALAARAGLADRGALPDSASRWSGQLWREQFAAFCEGQRDLHWPDPKPWLRGMDDGLSPTLDGVANRVDRLRCLGNAVVPSLAEFIGKQLLESINAR